MLFQTSVFMLRKIGTIKSYFDVRRPVVFVKSQNHTADALSQNNNIMIYTYSRLIPHYTPRSSQSATHRELHPRALLLISSS
jgi:hypothetical protein